MPHPLRSLLWCLAALPLAAQAQSFQLLPSALPGAPSPTTTVYAVSADGRVVVGAARSADGNEAFYWTPEGGMVSIGDLPGGPTSAGARGVSADGGVIVGEGRPTTGFQAFRWTATGGIEPLVGSIASGVSADGAVAVGSRTVAGSARAVRWTDGADAELLGDLPGGGTQSEALAVSADGATIVGRAQGAAGWQAFRWTAENGMEALGGEPGALFFSAAYGVSPDGSVVLGACSDSFGQACRRDADGVVSALPRPGTYVRQGRATGMSADGQVVVGSDWIGPSQPVAMLWTPAGGRILSELLEHDYGLDLSGALLWDVTAVSHDGTVLVGNAQTPAGIVGWRAVILPQTSASEPAAQRGALTLDVAPNPVRGTATLHLTLQAPTEASVAVYDVLGRRVATLHDGPLAAGRQALRLDAAGLRSGVYTVRVRSAEGLLARRLTVVR